MLKAQLPVKGDRIDYSYDTESDLHTLVFASNCAHITGSAGAIANYLAPYRGYREAGELFAWLVK